MPISKPLLTDAIRRMGPAEVFVGNPLVADGMLSIGTLEGERRGEIEYSDNILTMPEHSGDIPHDVLVSVSVARIACTIVLNGEGADVWPKINPLGSNAGGSSGFKRASTTSVLLIPRSELGAELEWDATLNAGAGGWKRTEEDGSVVSTSDADPAHALWLWKARVSHGSIPYSFEDGGKSRVDVTFEGMFDDTKPEGAKVFLIGNPRDFSTPIPVIL